MRERERERAVVYVKGRGRSDHWNNGSLGEGSVLDRPHVARALTSGAVRGGILRKHKAVPWWIQS